MKINPRYIVLCGSMACALAAGSIAGFEGKSNKAYLDLVQVPTICFGNTGPTVKLGDIKSDDECTRLMIAEINRLDAIITARVHYPLPDHVRAAILSWMYNVGEGNFYKSTLLKKLNRGDITGACNELPKWVNAKGKKLNGLVKRRASEQKMCLGEPND